MRKNIFGYSKKEVKEIIRNYEEMIDIQRRDIEYLKRDNQDLRTTLFELSSEIALKDKTRR
ncbi:MAG: hypothetical protein ACI4T8_02450 [Christensenellales bacterium]